MSTTRTAIDHTLGKVSWQDVPCPLCDARQETLLLEIARGAQDQPFRLVRCGRCGLGYVNPRPDEQSIAQFYSDDYEDHHRAEDRAEQGSSLRQRLQRLFRLGGPAADSFTSLPYQGEGRLLEYGCGTGWFGHRMRRLGWNVTGMDVSAAAVERAHLLFGLPVINGSLPHAAVGAESFDVITMGQVLEHVHWPHEVIAAAARALRPGGYLAVSVPNLDSWGFATFRADWHCLQLPIHLLHFTPATLRRLLEAHGLEVRTERMIIRPGWMRRSFAAVRQRPESPLPLWLRAVSRSRLAVRLLTKWTVAQQRGDCLFMLAYRPEGAAVTRAA